MQATCIDKPNKDQGGNWAPDACRYCRFRPLAPPSIPPGHKDHWLYGTGDGSHSPWKCKPTKRFLLEGGDSKTSAWADHLRQCIYVPKAPPS